jgi:glycosyltransferase involved in cell wall biosynthesis
MEIGFSAAVLSGGVRDRLGMTSKSINSLNNQTHKNLQKILVNGGSPPHQTQELLALGVNLDGWTILDFPIDTMDISSAGGVHRWNGQAALHASEKEFFFAMNDDDFLAPDFFDRMAIMFKKYPSAVTGMGLKVGYNHVNGEFGKPSHPKNKKGTVRPEFEPGLEVVREIFFRENLSYGPSLGFQPVCRTNMVLDVAQSFFSDGFYPDCSSFFQMVARGDMVFDSEAFMYWGFHNNNDSRSWDNKIYWYCNHEKIFDTFSRNNILVFKKYLPDNLSDAKKIKSYFLKRVVSYSLFAISDYCSIANFIKGKGKKISANKSNSEGVKFPIFRHLFVILKHPYTLVKVLQNNFKFLIIK